MSFILNLTGSRLTFRNAKGKVPFCYNLYCMLHLADRDGGGLKSHPPAWVRSTSYSLCSNSLQVRNRLCRLCSGWQCFNVLRGCCSLLCHGESKRREVIFLFVYWRYSAFIRDIWGGENKKANGKVWGFLYFECTLHLFQQIF